MKIYSMMAGFAFFALWAVFVTICILTSRFGAMILLNPFMFLSYFGSIVIARSLYRKMGAVQRADQGLDK